MEINALASAIINDVKGGLAGLTSNLNISQEQIEDEIIETRVSIIRELSLKGVITKKDLLLSIDGIPVNCEYLSKCGQSGLKGIHFEIPQLVNDLGYDAIEYIGSVDRQIPYKVYTDTGFLYHKHKKRKSTSPYVYIETTPNSNGMYDGFIFNVPFVKQISIIGIFKDPRQLDNYNCCNNNKPTNLSILSTEIKKRLVEQKLRYYRQFAAINTPNDQTIK